MKNKQIKFVATCKEVNEAERSLVVYASTKDIDRYGDIIMPEAFELAMYRKNPVVLWAHDYETPPVAKALWIKPDENGLIAKISFAKTQLAEDVFNLYKDGFMSAFSVGFIPKEWHEEKRAIKAEDGTEEVRNILIYDKVELLEFSAVPVPANAEALALAMQKGAIKSDRVKKDCHIEVEEKGTIEVAETEYEFSTEVRSLDFANKDYMFLTPVLKQDGVSALIAPIDVEWKATDEDTPKIKAHRFVFSKDFDWNPEKIQKWVEENADIVDDLAGLLWEKEFAQDQVNTLQAEKKALQSEITELKAEAEAPAKPKTIAEIAPEELSARVRDGVGRAISKLRGHKQ